MQNYLKSALFACALAFLAVPVQAKEYLKTDLAQTWGITPAVVTQGGKTVWMSGQVAIKDDEGNSLAGDFEGQARAIFRSIDAMAKRAGGSIKDVVNITVYLTDPRHLEPLQPIRREFWPDGNFPASTTITVSNLPFVGLLLEVSAVAVIDD